MVSSNRCEDQDAREERIQGLRDQKEKLRKAKLDKMRPEEREKFLKKEEDRQRKRLVQASGASTRARTHGA